MFTPPFYLFIVLYGKKRHNVLIYLYFNSQNVMIFIVREEIMKKKILLTVLIATLLTGCGKTIPELEDGKQAVVSFKDGSMISVDELYNELKSSATSTLIQMIDRKILESKYSDKVEEAKEYAKNTVESMKMYAKDDKGNYDESTLISMIRQYYGYSTIEDFQNSRELAYLQNIAIEDYVKDNLKDKELEDYYKDEIVGDREVYHIQIVPEVKSTSTDTEKKEAEEKALEEAKAIIARLKKGENFEDIAKSESDDEATKESGGSLGFINKGKYGSDEFDKEVYNLKVGEYSSVPIKTTNGYEIVYVKDEKEKKSLEDAKDEIIEKLVNSKLSEDATLQVTAIQELYKSYGLDIIDSELNRSYDKYMDNYMATARAQNNQSTSN